MVSPIRAHRWRIARQTAKVARVQLSACGIDDERPNTEIVDLRVHTGEAGPRASAPEAYDPDLRAGDTWLEQRPTTVALTRVFPLCAGGDHEAREVPQVRWLRRIGPSCSTVGDDRNRHLAHAVRTGAALPYRAPACDRQLVPRPLQPVLFGGGKPDRSDASHRGVELKDRGIVSEAPPDVEAGVDKGVGGEA